MQIIFTFILVVLYLGVAANALLAFGDCPDVESQSTLDASRYAGTWYELKRFPNFNEGDLRCASAQYTLKSDGKISVRNQGYFPNGTLDFIVGTAQVVDTAKPAELSVDLGFGWPSTIPNYFVLETDYDTYSVVHSCFQMAPMRRETAWILIRDRDADIDVSAIEQRLSQAGMDISNFKPVDQQDCP